MSEMIGYCIKKDPDDIWPDCHVVATLHQKDNGYMLTGINEAFPTRKHAVEFLKLIVETPGTWRDFADASDKVMGWDSRSSRSLTNWSTYNNGNL